MKRPVLSNAIPALLILLPVLLCFGKGMTGSWTMIPLDVLYSMVAPWSQHPPGPGFQAANPVISDQVLQFEPWAEFTRQELAAGRLPLWNPYVAGGVPFMANPQTTFFYPLSMPISVCLPDRAPAIRAGLHIFLAAWFMLLFLRRLGLAGAPALFGAISFSFSQFLTVWIGFPIGWTLAWLPAWFYFTERLCTEMRALPTVFLTAGVVGLSILAGHPESTFHTAVIALIYAAFRSAGVHGWLKFWKGCFRLGIASTLGACLAAIMLIPFSEYLLHSAAFNDPSVSCHGAFASPGGHLLGLIFPRIFGGPSLNVLLLNFNERASYAGLITLLLATSILLRRKAWQGPWPVLTGIGVFGLLTSHDLVGLQNLVGQVPGFAMTWNHRLIFLVVFTLSALGALSLDTLAASRRPWFWVWPIVLLFCVSLVILVFPDLPVFPGLKKIPEDVVRQAVFLAMGLSTSFLLVLLLVRKHPGWLTGLVILIGGVDVVGFAMGLNTMAPAAWRNLPTAEILAIQKEEPGRLIGLHNSFAPASALPHRIRTLASYEALGVHGFQQLVAPILPVREENLGDARYRLLGVTHLYTRSRVRTPPPGWEHVKCGQGHLYRIADSMPRVFVASKLRMVRDNAQLQSILSSRNFVPEDREVVCAFGAKYMFSGRPFDPRKDRAEILVDLPGRIEINANLAGPGMLVLADAFFPGWKVTVNGHPWYAHPVYGGLRGVPLTGGKKKVVFQYAPLSLFWGFLVTLLGLGCWIGGLVWSLRGLRGRTDHFPFSGETTARPFRKKKSPKPETSG